ncbi:unnamed protein product [Microthlaspi erraticum]|uniref:Secreted protein n=1 Tax=Microthlaspi erraticum TaxID=1685480 RepID=A0A6D2LJT3_9BRAS|nr:unnamed protein product [Microthlaspi erraticum]
MCFLSSWTWLQSMFDFLLSKVTSSSLVFNQSSLNPASVRSANSLRALLSSVSEKLCGGLLFSVSMRQRRRFMYVVFNTLLGLKFTAKCGCSLEKRSH